MTERTQRGNHSSCNVVDAERAREFELVALAKLKELGLRVTMPRVQVVRALGVSRKAMSAYAVHEQILAGGGRIDVVSVYRILSTLREAGIIHRIGSVDGFLPCQMHEHSIEHTQHMICIECGCVTEIPISADQTNDIERQAKDSNFKVRQITIEIDGVCPHCA